MYIITFLKDIATLVSILNWSAKAATTQHKVRRMWSNQAICQIINERPCFTFSAFFECVFAIKTEKNFLIILFSFNLKMGMKKCDKTGKGLVFD